jgi:hypothetical protein
MAQRRTILEFALFGALFIAIAWWFFGGAAFAVWMTAYHTDAATIHSWQLKFCADVLIGSGLLIAFTIGFLKMKVKKKIDSK